MKKETSTVLLFDWKEECKQINLLVREQQSCPSAVALERVTVLMFTHIYNSLEAKKQKR